MLTVYLTGFKRTTTSSAHMLNITGTVGTIHTTHAGRRTRNTHVVCMYVRDPIDDEYNTINGQMQMLVYVQIYKCIDGYMYSNAGYYLRQCCKMYSK